MSTKLWLVIVLPVLWLALGQTAPSTQPSAAQLWDDFNHYVLIARPELAAAAGEALLNDADPDRLLDVVEASRFQNYEQTLVRASKMAGVAEVARRLDQAIRQGSVGRIRDPQRLRQAIERLGEGERARLRATDLLREAGQFAAPALLETLLAPERQRLHPYVRQAMMQVGRPLVYPLSVALGQLDASGQRQVGQVLGQIGYPRALPYLKQLLESGHLDPETTQVLTAAYEQIAAGAASTSADQLFLRLASDFYQSESRGSVIPGYDTQTDQGIVWQYTPQTGLVKVEVPPAIFGDVLAMDAARHALGLNSNLDAALSLWLAANLRRENRLQAGQVDPTYRLANPASFYAMMAGPPRQQDALAMALTDTDSALARDAIAALASTAGTFQMVQGGQAVQPLLDALGYPDRRVRFEAALALTNARPTTPFPGSFRVVPVLAEALRQTAQRFAVVLADQSQLRELTAAVNELGYTPISGSALGDVSGQIQAAPGIALLVVAADTADVAALKPQAQQDSKLRSVPIVALVKEAELATANEQLGRLPQVFVTGRASDAAALGAIIERATQSVAGAAMPREEASDYALRALAALREIAVARGEVFNVADAQPTLIEALRDPKPPLVLAAVNVLSLINSEEAQRAIAELALEPQVSAEMRVAVLGSLAESATYWGNRLTPIQLDRLAALTGDSDGALALAAGRAYGALALPTANVVRMLVQ